MIEGGPCIVCGITQSSIWYGKKDNKNCKKSGCMRECGYLLPKKVKHGSAAAKRARAAAATDVKEEDEELINLELTVSEVIDIYGQRCPHRARARRWPAARRPRVRLAVLHS